jgi:hypothetical protein
MLGDRGVSTERSVACWARSLDVARSLSQPRLIDHLPELLSRVADVILPKLHALERLHRGFDLKEVVDEYGLLRRCVLDAFRAAHGDAVSVVEVQRFGETIDGAIARFLPKRAPPREALAPIISRRFTPK